MRTKLKELVGLVLERYLTAALTVAERPGGGSATRHAVSMASKGHDQLGLGWVLLYPAS